MDDGVIEAILWDCDGVLQHPSIGWADVLHELGGEDFAVRLFEAEKVALRGEATMRSVVEQFLADGSCPATAEEVLDLWRQFDPDEDAWRIVDDARRAGRKCVLATNQQDLRLGIMRGELGYDERVDRAYYSCEVGQMKPSPEYFEAVLADLGITPSAALFVDDSAANIRTARAMGIVAVHHDPASGADALRREIEQHLAL